MSTIVTRAGKGAPLTNAEVDANFTNLNADKIQVTGTPVNGYTITWDSATSTWVPSAVGSGDLVGPASSTDNAITRFDGTTGKLVQNSTATLDDSGNADFTTAKADALDLDVAATPAAAVGRFSWDDGNGTAQLGMKGGAVTLQLGQEVLSRVYNDSGSTLVDGQVVYISGSQGNRIAVKLAKADSESTSAGTLGIVTESIASGAEGFITMVGTVHQLDTTGLTAGALIYLSDTTAGAYTMTAPTPPHHRVTLGYVERVHATVGSIYVKVDNGYEIEELHNVLITTPATNDFFVRASDGLWKNRPLASGDVTTALGFTPYDASNPTGYITSSALSGYLTTSTAASTYAPISTTVTLTGTETLTNKTLTAPTMTGAVLSSGYTETPYAVVDAAGVALSPTNGSVQTWTLGANRVPTLGTWAAGQSMTLHVNDTASVYTVDWTTSMGVVWVGGSAPALTPGGGYTVIGLWKLGTTIYGVCPGQVA